MAFAFTIQKTLQGVNQKLVVGTYTNATSTGGDIKTGLSTCYSMVLTPNAAAVTNAHVTNETFPVSGGEITIVTGNNESGQFFAVGD